jgi:hypothetical protein
MPTAAAAAAGSHSYSQMLSSAHNGIGSRSVCISNDGDLNSAQPAAAAAVAAAIGSHSSRYIDNSASSGMCSFLLADCAPFSEDTPATAAAAAGGSSRRGNTYLRIVKSHALDVIDDDEIDSSSSSSSSYSSSSSSSHSGWRMRKSARSNVRSHPLAHCPGSYVVVVYDSAQRLTAAAVAAVAGAGNLRYRHLRSNAPSSIRSYPLADCAYGYLSAPASGAVLRNRRRSSQSCGAMLLSAGSGVVSFCLTDGFGGAS